MIIAEKKTVHCGGCHGPDSIDHPDRFASGRLAGLAV